MAIQKITIREFLKGALDHLLLDVRSPAEYSHAHIPGAYNLPLFSNDERKVVGTIYKQQSRQQAIKTGLDLFGPKMRKMVEEVETLLQSNHTQQTTEKEHTGRSVFIYCWRGGMRSAAIAWLLDLYGFKVYVLAGGYKTYRNDVLRTFLLPYRFMILGGYTGTGKTDVLHQLEKNGEQVIDLEKLAAHKGSAFGSLKMPPQPTQEMFENFLAKQLLQKCKSQDLDEEFASFMTDISPLSSENYSTIWLEDESQRIGNLNIPGGIWQNMRKSPVVFLEIPFDERLEYIVREYGICNQEELIEAVQRITKRLGGVETKQTIEFLQLNNKKEAFRILLLYYDKLYLKALHNRDNLPELVSRVSCSSVKAENASVLSKYQTV